MINGDESRNLHYPLCFPNPLRAMNSNLVGDKLLTKIICEINELICPTQSNYEVIYDLQGETDEMSVKKYPNSLFVLYPTRIFVLGKNFTSIPHLTIRQSYFEYFLDGMDSLISIWENTKLDYEKAYYDENKGGKITIEDSTFHYSRFCKGLIAYNYWKEKDPVKDWEIYIESGTSKRNEDELAYMLTISGSEFKNLNYHNERKMVKKLNISSQGDIRHSYSSFTWTQLGIANDVYASLHKGSVLNLQGFPGSIYITNSQFLYVFILYIYIYIDRTRTILMD